MYGGSSKLGGRGGGGGAGRGAGPGGGNKRPPSSSFPLPPPHRPSSTTSRLSLGSKRSAVGASSTAATEETFSLMPGKIAFGMIIRLAPGLVEEIRRVEGQGGTARIKFDSVPTNPTGNVIDVGGKEFRFTWSTEVGGLCDIYEERQSGKNGNGVLVESGGAWRKVNVQRILDESTTNHVKMLSVEAERKSKSRKAIVLDHGNPSKSQIKAMVAAETNSWRHSKNKKEPPFKKRKVDPPQGGPPKSAVRPGSISNVNAKHRRSPSPLSAPEQSGHPSSPFVAAAASKIHLSTEEIAPTPVKSKENATISEKETTTKVTNSIQGTLLHKGSLGTKPMDLQSTLTTLLTENPKGLSLKALEKAVGDVIPNSAKKIEPIIKKIATFQAPGRYILKPGVELDSFKKPSSDSGSSPEDIRQQQHAAEVNYGQKSAAETSIAEKVPAAGLEEPTQLNSILEESSNTTGKLDVKHQSLDLFGEKKTSDNSEGKAGTSSESGSDSDSESDSSDSGTHSRSRSGSRSPVESTSGSSSDSESDASVNSKEVSDEEEVDIMTSNDDKEPQNKLQASEPRHSVSPNPGSSEHNRINEKQGDDLSDAVDIEDHGSAAIDIEGHDSDAIDIEKDSGDDESLFKVHAKDGLLSSKEGEKRLEEVKSLSSDHDMVLERQNFIGNLFDDNEDLDKDSLRPEMSDSSEKTPKKGSDKKKSGAKSERAKRLKAERLSQQPVSAGGDTEFSRSPQSMHIDEFHKGPNIQGMNRPDRETVSDFGSQKVHSQLHSVRRSSEQGMRAKALDRVGPVKHAENSVHGRKLPEKDFHVHESFPFQREKACKDIQNEDSIKDKKVQRNPKEGGAGGRHSAPSDSRYRKMSENFGKAKDSGQVLKSHAGSSPKDNNRADMDKNPVVSGKGLQRELSDLELGELRELLPEETPVKKQLEKKGSFKQAENRTSTSDHCNLDSSKGKSVGKATLDLGKTSSPNTNNGIKRTPEHHFEDSFRSQYKVVQSQPQLFSRVENLEVGSQLSKLVDTNNRSRNSESGVKLGNVVERNVDKKASISGLQLHDSKHASLSQPVKESKTQTSSAMAELLDGKRSKIISDGKSNARKKRESSSEEDSLSYLKYEKDAPDLKGPIKDFSQYKEYVQEYRDKYDDYCSLNNILETYRNEFEKLGKDLNFAKDRDMDRYHKILAQMRESYGQCSARHKRLKNIFIVLHQELMNVKQRIKDFAHMYTKD
ncbi:hypothetical protein K2173_024423 [Erythroxylum novogranatense]|uniref:OCEL domain-containing protein n=1 Tax=Erythroxylum novogranatense TaxID=1862640 RepID=A0AAV8SUJ1_9ROSI|nr:hypothetical protein K2173_024423 [Erythroxylum novogranatense]